MQQKRPLGQGTAEYTKVKKTPTKVEPPGQTIQYQYLGRVLKAYPGVLKSSQHH